MSGKDWSAVALVISGSANGIVLLPAILGLVLWFRVRGHRKLARAWMAILFAGVMAGLVGTTCRSLIGRTRPEVAVEQGWFGPRKEGKWILGRHAYSAFPSGHASIAAGIGFMAFIWGRRAGRIGVVYALAVAWSRFHLGAHRASDVWAGLMVGSLAAAILLPRLEDWVHRGVTPEWWPRRLMFQGLIASK
jgi:membrane-associated phospholipid phosphatase